MLSRLERYRGAVLGAAIGDALGHPLEFLSLEEIHARFGPRGAEGFKLYWREEEGPLYAPYTDDTQMAEVVLRALLLEGEEMEPCMELMAQGFVEWMNNPQGGHRAPGNACLSGCRALARGRHWSEAGGARAGGCGSVMRSYPFGLRFPDQPQRAEAWAVSHSRMTHQDPIALAACAAMAQGIASAIRGEPVSQTLALMLEAAARWDQHTAAMMARAQREAEAGDPPEKVLEYLQAWAAHEAIAAACYLLARNPEDLRTGLLEGANSPGDSDSIATLIGALLGARLGVDALPSEWVRDVERSETLDLLAQTLFKRS